MAANCEYEPDPRWGESSPTHNPHILANFKARASDIIISTSPKCGTTWMQQILHQLKTGGDDSFNAIDDVAPWLEVNRQGRHFAEVNSLFEKLPNPRIFKTHCTYEQAPGTDIARFILSTRDPRDACVSFYYHVMNLTEETRRQTHVSRPENFEEYFENWLESRVWYRNISSWWPHRNRDNVLILRYEDLVSDFETSIERIVKFLQWKIAEDRKKTIMEFCSFNWMKEYSDRFTHRDESGNLFFVTGSFIRRGRVGDYRQLLSETQQKRILETAKEELESSCLDFLGLN